MYVYVEQIGDNKYYRGHGEIESKLYENIQSKVFNIIQICNLYCDSTDQQGNTRNF